MTKEQTVKTPDLGKILKTEHENKWVAISPDYKEIVSSGETLKDVFSSIDPHQRNKVVFHKVLPFGVYYEPFFHEVSL